MSGDDPEQKCGGNKRKAAKMPGIGATSLYRKLGTPAEEDTTDAGIRDES